MRSYSFFLRAVSWLLIFTFSFTETIARADSESVSSFVSVAAQTSAQYATMLAQSSNRLGLRTYLAIEKFSNSVDVRSELRAMGLEIPGRSELRTGVGDFEPDPFMQRKAHGQDVPVPKSNKPINGNRLVPDSVKDKVFGTLWTLDDRVIGYFLNMDSSAFRDARPKIRNYKALGTFLMPILARLRRIQSEFENEIKAASDESRPVRSPYHDEVTRELIPATIKSLESILNGQSTDRSELRVQGLTSQLTENNSDTAKDPKLSEDLRPEIADALSKLRNAGSDLKVIRQAIHDLSRHGYDELKVMKVINRINQTQTYGKMEFWEPNVKRKWLFQRTAQFPKLTRALWIIAMLSVGYFSPYMGAIMWFFWMYYEIVYRWGGGFYFMARFLGDSWNGRMENIQNFLVKKYHEPEYPFEDGLWLNPIDRAEDLVFEAKQVFWKSVLDSIGGVYYVGSVLVFPWMLASAPSILQNPLSIFRIGGTAFAGIAPIALFGLVPLRAPHLKATIAGLAYEHARDQEVFGQTGLHWPQFSVRQNALIQAAQFYWNQNSVIQYWSRQNDKHFNWEWQIRRDTTNRFLARHFLWVSLSIATILSAILVFGITYLLASGIVGAAQFVMQKFNQSLLKDLLLLMGSCCFFPFAAVLGSSVLIYGSKEGIFSAWKKASAGIKELRQNVFLNPKLSDEAYWRSLTKQINRVAKEISPFNNIYYPETLDSLITSLSRLKEESPELIPVYETLAEQERRSELRTTQTALSIVRQVFPDSEEYEDAAKMIDALEIGPDDKILAVGIGATQEPLIAAALRGAQVDVVQPDVYMQNQYEILKKRVGKDSQKLAEHFRRDLIGGRINLESYRTIIQQAGLPKNHYTKVLIFSVLDDGTSARRQNPEVLDAIHQAIQSRATILVSALFPRVHSEKLVEEHFNRLGSRAAEARRTFDGPNFTTIHELLVEKGDISENTKRSELRATNRQLIWKVINQFGIPEFYQEQAYLFLSGLLEANQGQWKTPFEDVISRLSQTQVEQIKSSISSDPIANTVTSLRRRTARYLIYVVGVIVLTYAAGAALAQDINLFKLFNQIGKQKLPGPEQISIGFAAIFLYTMFIGLPFVIAHFRSWLEATIKPYPISYDLRRAILNELFVKQGFMSQDDAEELIQRNYRSELRGTYEKLIAAVKTPGAKIKQFLIGRIHQKMRDPSQLAKGGERIRKITKLFGIELSDADIRVYGLSFVALLASRIVIDPFVYVVIPLVIVPLSFWIGFMPAFIICAVLSGIVNGVVRDLVILRYFRKLHPEVNVTMLRVLSWLPYVSSAFLMYPAQFLWLLRLQARRADRQPDPRADQQEKRSELRVKQSNNKAKTLKHLEADHWHWLRSLTRFFVGSLALVIAATTFIWTHEHDRLPLHPSGFRIFIHLGALGIISFYIFRWVIRYFKTGSLLRDKIRTLSRSSPVYEFEFGQIRNKLLILKTPDRGTHQLYLGPHGNIRIMSFRESEQGHVRFLLPYGLSIRRDKPYLIYKGKIELRAIGPHKIRITLQDKSLTVPVIRESSLNLIQKIFIIHPTIIGVALLYTGMWQRFMYLFAHAFASQIGGHVNCVKCIEYFEFIVDKWAKYLLYGIPVVYTVAGVVTKLTVLFYKKYLRTSRMSIAPSEELPVKPMLFSKMQGETQDESSTLNVHPFKERQIGRVIRKLKAIRESGLPADDRTIQNLYRLTRTVQADPFDSPDIEFELTRWLEESADLKAIAAIVTGWFQAHSDSTAKVIRILERRFGWNKKQIEKLKHLSASDSIPLEETVVVPPSSREPIPYRDQLKDRSIYKVFGPEFVDEVIERIDSIDAKQLKDWAQKVLNRDQPPDSSMTIRSIFVHGSYIYGSIDEPRDLDLIAVVEGDSLQKPFQDKYAIPKVVFKSMRGRSVDSSQIYFLTRQQLQMNKRAVHAANAGILIHGKNLYDEPLESIRNSEHGRLLYVVSELSDAFDYIKKRSEAKGKTSEEIRLFKWRAFRRLAEAVLYIHAIDPSLLVPISEIVTMRGHIENYMGRITGDRKITESLKRLYRIANTAALLTRVSLVWQQMETLTGDQRSELRQSDKIFSEIYSEAKNIGRFFMLQIGPRFFPYGDMGHPAEFVKHFDDEDIGKIFNWIYKISARLRSSLGNNTAVARLNYQDLYDALFELESELIGYAYMPEVRQIERKLARQITALRKLSSKIQLINLEYMLEKLLEQLELRRLKKETRRNSRHFNGLLFALSAVHFLGQTPLDVIAGTGPIKKDAITLRAVITKNILDAPDQFKTLAMIRMERAGQVLLLKYFDSDLHLLSQEEIPMPDNSARQLFLLLKVIAGFELFNLEEWQEKKFSIAQDDDPTKTIYDFKVRFDPEIGKPGEDLLFVYIDRREPEENDDDDDSFVRRSELRMPEWLDVTLWGLWGVVVLATTYLFIHTVRHSDEGAEEDAGSYSSDVNDEIVGSDLNAPNDPTQIGKRSELRHEARRDETGSFFNAATVERSVLSKQLWRSVGRLNRGTSIQLFRRHMKVGEDTFVLRGRVYPKSKVSLITRPFLYFALRDVQKVKAPQSGIMAIEIYRTFRENQKTVQEPIGIVVGNLQTRRPDLLHIFFVDLNPEWRGKGILRRAFTLLGETLPKKVTVMEFDVFHIDTLSKLVIKAKEYDPAWAQEFQIEDALSANDLPRLYNTLLVLLRRMKQKGEHAQSVFTSELIQSTVAGILIAQAGFSDFRLNFSEYNSHSGKEKRIDLIVSASKPPVEKPKKPEEPNVHTFKRKPKILRSKKFSDALLNSPLSFLNDQQKKILKLHYGLDSQDGRKRLEDIHQELKISKERVRQIEDEALALARRFYQTKLWQNQTWPLVLSDLKPGQQAEVYDYVMFALPGRVRSKFTKIPDANLTTFLTTPLLNSKTNSSEHDRYVEILGVMQEHLIVTPGDRSELRSEKARFTDIVEDLFQKQLIGDLNALLGKSWNSIEVLNVVQNTTERPFKFFRMVRDKEIANIKDLRTVGAGKDIGRRELHGSLDAIREPLTKFYNNVVFPVDALVKDIRGGLSFTSANEKQYKDRLRAVIPHIEKFVAAVKSAMLPKESVPVSSNLKESANKNLDQMLRTYALDTLQKTIQDQSNESARERMKRFTILLQLFSEDKGFFDSFVRSAESQPQLLDATISRFLRTDKVADHAEEEPFLDIVKLAGFDMPFSRRSNFGNLLWMDLPESDKHVSSQILFIPNLHNGFAVVTKKGSEVSIGDATEKQVSNFVHHLRHSIDHLRKESANRPPESKLGELLRIYASALEDFWIEAVTHDLSDPSSEVISEKPVTLSEAGLLADLSRVPDLAVRPHRDLIAHPRGDVVTAGLKTTETVHEPAGARSELRSDVTLELIEQMLREPLTVEDFDRDLPNGLEGEYGKGNIKIESVGNFPNPDQIIIKILQPENSLLASADIHEFAEIASKKVEGYAVDGSDFKKFDSGETGYQIKFEKWDIVNQRARENLKANFSELGSSLLEDIRDLHLGGLSELRSDARIVRLLDQGNNKLVPAAILYMDLFLTFKEQGAELQDLTGNDLFKLSSSRQPQEGMAYQIVFTPPSQPSKTLLTVLSEDGEKYNQQETDHPVFFKFDSKMNLIAVDISLDKEQTEFLELEILRRADGGRLEPYEINEEIGIAMREGSIALMNEVKSFRLPVSQLVLRARLTQNLTDQNRSELRERQSGTHDDFNTLNVQDSATPAAKSELREIAAKMEALVPKLTAETTAVFEKFAGLQSSDESAQTQILGILPNLGRLADLRNAIIRSRKGKNKIVVFAGTRSELRLIQEFLDHEGISREQAVVTQVVDADLIFGAQRNAQLVLTGLPNDEPYAFQVTRLLHDFDVKTQIGTVEMLEGIFKIADTLRSELRQRMAALIAA